MILPEARRHSGRSNFKMCIQFCTVHGADDDANHP
jgi:hypothetical protein